MGQLVHLFGFRPFCKLLLVVLLIALAACSSAPGTLHHSESSGPGVGILLFGDSGYHLDYPDQDDFVDLFSEEEYLQKEWDDWVEDKRPKDEFQARPAVISPVTGKTVTATGMNLVSGAMKSFCRDDAACDFGVMLGDNIYPSGATLGADGKADSNRFYDIFQAPYGNLVDHVPDYKTYVVLGNHDWETSREGGLAQIEYLENSDAFYMDGPFYRVMPPAGKGEIELFVIDTSMMLASTTVYKDILDDNGWEVATEELDLPDYFVEPMTEAERNMASWLDDALQNSTASWKIVVTHHPIWSSAGSKFQEARALRKMILPSVCRYADLLLAGHEHTLEVHTDDCSAALGEATEKPLVQIVSGAASKQRPINSRFVQYQGWKYPEQETLFARGLLWGFAHMQIEGDRAKVQLMTVSGEGHTDIVYEYGFERRSGQ